MADFNDCIHHCGLFDLSSTGQLKSWCNGHERVSRSWAKLDRALINSTFSILFGSAHLKYLGQKSLDHCPMVVYVNRQLSLYGPPPFWFQNMWSLHETFLSCVKDAWCRMDMGSRLFKLATHLKRTKVVLRACNRCVFGRVGANIQALEERLDVLENQLQAGYSMEDEDDYLAMKLELQVWEKRESTRLGQIAKRKKVN
ncbi:hypothetical protein F2P56_019614 [Juglans regia]|uniref:Uncharacterized protein n=2 Tax=Juglans regia TaxID=51240 RepID=A0A833UUQ7_JUGRE|nr:uncharacterized protein LOC108997357 [Juglans regia]KAF5459690.1 hypothetical protein F2P56_019614 [Juglans regia]